jgi:hypothetical protein
MLGFFGFEAAAFGTAEMTGGVDVARPLLACALDEVAGVCAFGDFGA